MKRKLLAFDGKSADNFGGAVAVSEDYAIVGAQGEDTAGNSAGAAYVFERSGLESWNSGTKLKAPDADTDDLFGASVGVSGDYILVGAMGEDAGGKNSAGAAYVYRRTGAATWNDVTKLTALDAASGDRFGVAVAISGDYAIVGAGLEDERGIDAGAVYIYRRTAPNTWDAGVKRTAPLPDGRTGDEFGTAVSISGDYAIVGAHLEDDGGNNAGAAYVYRRTGPNAWDSGTKLIAPDAQAGDQFGRSVSIAGDYAIVGAFGEDAAGNNAGAAYVYRRTGLNTWDGGTKLTATDAESGDQFGRSISIFGDKAIVGAFGEDAAGSNAGAAYVYRRTGSNIWDAGTKITATDAQSGDQFGESVAISKGVAIVGAPLEDDGSTNNGAAYLFQ